MSAAFELYREGGRVGARYAFGKVVAAFLFFFLLINIFSLLGLGLYLLATDTTFDEIVGLFDCGPDAPALGVVAGVLFMTVFGLVWLIPGVWLMQRLLHRRAFAPVLGVEQRFNPRAALSAGLATMVVAGIGVAAAAATGLVALDLREAPPGWALYAAPIALLIPFQAAAEEIVFRGYMLQTLAARYRSPLIWAGFPAALFALMHAFGDPCGGDQTPYVFATFVFALFATALVWRIGGLSAAIGVHAANNIVALLLFNAPFGVGGLGLVTVTPAPGTIWASILLDCLTFVALYFVILRIVRPEGAAR